MTTDLLVLVERCRQGDDLAWEQLVRRCQGRVYALAYHYLGRFEDARDVAQEVSVRVYLLAKAVQERRDATSSDGSLGVVDPPTGSFGS